MWFRHANREGRDTRFRPDAIRVSMYLIGIAALLSPFAMFVGGGSGWLYPPDRREAPADAAAAVRAAMRAAKLDVRVTLVRPRAESLFTDSEPIEGWDWFACDLFPADVTRLRAASTSWLIPPTTRPSPRPGDGITMMAGEFVKLLPDLTSGSPPSWWDAATCTDLIWAHGGEKWIILLSPSRGRLYLRQSRGRQ